MSGSEDQYIEGARFLLAQRLKGEELDAAVSALRRRAERAAFQAFVAEVHKTLKEMNATMAG